MNRAGAPSAPRQGETALRILAPTRYPWRFNGPRGSRHHVENRNFAPLNKVSPKIEGVTVFNPWPPRRFDLIHAFNRIPIGWDPYIIGFESHLPRAYWFEDTAYYEALIKSLAGDRCRRIVAISEHARQVFVQTHERHPRSGELFAKLEVRAPNLVLPEEPDPLAEDDLALLRVAFVGGHFARKGGCVAVRVAELARERDLPIEVNIMSSLEMGSTVWTDPTRAAFFEPYLEMLKQKNVRHVATGSNAEALSLMRTAHFSLLTTFGDTFGYSAIESMAQGTPVIGTRQGALPEFIDDGVSGVLLDLQTNSRGEWIYAASDQRDTLAFEAIFRSEVERLAQETLAALEKALNDPESYRRMRRQARRAAERFDHRSARDYWDALYETCSRR